MSWALLNLWVDEEQRIHQCLKEALQQLIIERIIHPTDEEKSITGKLRPILNHVCKHNRLDWTLHSESSSFAKEDDPDPFARPDIRFSRLDPEYNQYDYDVECKLVRVKRPEIDTDYCYHYLKKGVLRYLSGKYAPSYPPMGTMLGYVQVGDLLSLLDTINQKVKYQQKQHQGLHEINLNGTVKNEGVTHLSQNLQRDTESFILVHLWADLRHQPT